MTWTGDQSKTGITLWDKEQSKVIKVEIETLENDETRKEFTKLTASIDGSQHVLSEEHKEIVDVARHGKTKSFADSATGWQLEIGNVLKRPHDSKYWLKVGGVRVDELPKATRSTVIVPDLAKSDTLAIYNDHLK